MSILVDKGTRLLVQGITGREGSFHTAQMVEYGCATLHLNHRRIVPWQRATVVAAGVPLVLYTVNNGLAARRCLEAGIAAVFTDHIDRVLAALAQAPGPRSAAQPKGEPSPPGAPS